MIQSVSEVGASMQEKWEKGEKRREGKRWGPFQYFLIVSSVLLLVMWGVIIFGGPTAPPRTAVVD
jgi:hypothetical protein